MDSKNRIYLPAQLKALMPEQMLKVIDLLFIFQKEDATITYSKKNSLFLHMDEVITDQAIQTAIDINLLLPVGVENGIYKFKINQDVIKKFQEIALKDIQDKNLINLSGNITFKTRMSQGDTSAPKTEMSTEEMQKMILMLQAQLMQKKNSELSY